ncbi:hypothetical protein UA3_00891 [Enterococcus faecium EnGen0263]|uniref:CDP-glycerol glycerophosphotransferase family protein n=1 Tax=Enterococcus faecium TaxID=1352 RepID=UPI00032E5024|nr:CDP-glycerol glycerophosphotransferase family protein [Enterococcus faecium]EOH56824.1 hypothetical protein UA3_00891 [Enterococcus faecium EnGen0263]
MNKGKLVFNGLIALLLYFIRKPFIVKKNWIFGYNLGKSYAGSNKVFFEYMLNQKKNCYFVIRKNYNNGNVPDSKYLIDWGSIRNYLMVFESEVSLVSHSPADVLPIYYRLVEFLRVKLVYNSHGIDGLKMWLPTKELTEYKYYFLINAISEFEKNTRIRYLGVDEKNVKITGFTTFDTLIRKDKESRDKNKDKNKILMMMTWREYESDLDKKILSFLKNEDLLIFLEKQNLAIDVIIHDFYVDKFYANNSYKDIEKYGIKFIKNTNIEEIVPNYNLLITDYSSIAWLFLFLKKPVIFYQFDQKKYLEYHGGSLIDYNSNNFLSKVVYTEKQLINECVKLAKVNFVLDEKYEKNAKKYITYFDDKNCYRLYKEILSLLNKE